MAELRVEHKGFDSQFSALCNCLSSGTIEESGKTSGCDWGGEDSIGKHAQRKVLRWWWQVVERDRQESLVFRLSLMDCLSSVDITMLHGRT